MLGIVFKKQLNHGMTFRFGTLYLSCNFACFSSHVPGLVNLVLPLKVAETEIIETFCWIVEFNFLFQLLLVSLDKICFLWCEECWKDWIKCWILLPNSELTYGLEQVHTYSTQIPLSGCQLHWKVWNKCKQWCQRWSNCVHNASRGENFYFWPGTCSLL